MASFPKPYINDVKKDDSTMVYVPMDTMDIGARSVSLPKGPSGEGMTIAHVGSSAPAKG